MEKRPATEQSARIVLTYDARSDTSAKLPIPEQLVNRSHRFLNVFVEVSGEAWVVGALAPRRSWSSADGPSAHGAVGAFGGQCDLLREAN